MRRGRQESERERERWRQLPCWVLSVWPAPLGPLDPVSIIFLIKSAWAFSVPHPELSQRWIPAISEALWVWKMPNRKRVSASSQPSWNVFFICVLPRDSQVVPLQLGIALLREWDMVCGQPMMSGSQGMVQRALLIGPLINASVSLVYCFGFGFASCVSLSSSVCLVLPSSCPLTALPPVSTLWCLFVQSPLTWRNHSPWQSTPVFSCDRAALEVCFTALILERPCSRIPQPSDPELLIQMLFPQKLQG